VPGRSPEPAKDPIEDLFHSKAAIAAAPNPSAITSRRARMSSTARVFGVCIGMLLNKVAFAIIRPRRPFGSKAAEVC
jgi:hypothetical protein